MEKIINAIIIIIVVLVTGALIFDGFDKALGEKTVTTEIATVVDIHTRTVMSGTATMRKYYITVKTENGNAVVAVTHTTYENVEVNSEIEVIKTTYFTKWTKETQIVYSIDF